MTREDPSNWSEFPNIDGEVRGLLDRCDWYQTYDAIEAIHEHLSHEHADAFELKLNTFFRHNGIGWQLTNGRIEIRGPEAFEQSVHRAQDQLCTVRLQTASREIHEALRDLSRRPEADVTGAIQHSVAALECTMREAVGENGTLGDLLKRHRGIFPAPLDTGVEKIWGYALEFGRHLREGRGPSMDEAQLIVSVSAAAAEYVSAKLRDRSDPDHDIPF
ncbi:MAG: AbiJ-NTD4 domain-containing protein [Chloroflexota bacterium]